jgi:hypothetical protein
MYENTHTYLLDVIYLCGDPVCLVECAMEDYIIYIKSVPSGKVKSLGDHSIGHSRQKKCIRTCILFRMVSKIELFHCTVPKLLIRKRYYVLFLILSFTDNVVVTVYLV